MPDRNKNPSKPTPESSSGGTRPPRKPPGLLAQAGDDDKYDGIKDTIESFEAILKANPNDRSVLETLWMAYRQIGDFAQSRHYLIRLAEVLVQENTLTGIQAIESELKQAARNDDRAASTLANLNKLILKKTKNSPPSIMDSELSLLYDLHKARHITEPEYSISAKQLTESLALLSQAHPSSLRVLEQIVPSKFDVILEYVSRKYHTPVVSLDDIALTDKKLNQLSLTFTIPRNALVFGESGSMLLLVLLNPTSQLLHSAIHAFIHQECQYHICRPSEFDRAIVRLRSSRS